MDGIVAAHMGQFAFLLHTVYFYMIYVRAFADP